MAEGVLDLSGWVEVFRVGTWNGVFYGKDYLEKMKENFDKGVSKVVAFIGHQYYFQDEKPALAHAADMRIRGTRLDVRFKNVLPELREAVLSGKYTDRSIEHYHDYNGKGPTLVGVAFLGASAPAVDGMADCQKSFEAADGRVMMSRADLGLSVVTFEASKRPEEERWDEDWASGAPEKETGSGKQGGGKEEEDVALTEAEKKSIVADAIAQFKETPEYKGLVQKAEKAEELQTGATEALKKAVETAAEAFVTDLVTNKKKLTPALADKGLKQFLVELEQAAPQPVKFGAEEQTLAKWFKGFIGDLLDASSLFKTTELDDDETQADPEKKGAEGMPTEEDAADVTKPLTFSFGAFGRK